MRRSPFWPSLAVAAITCAVLAACGDEIVTGSLTEGDADAAQARAEVGDGGADAGIDAAVEAGEDATAVDDAGDATAADTDVAAPCPAGQKCPCTTDAECETGKCIIDPATGTGVCAEPCQAGKCPAGFVCTTVTTPGGATAELCLPEPKCQPVAEACNGKDDNCDGAIDEGFCFDGNPCTDDACTSGGECTHPNNTLPCSDNNACTAGDACKDGQCVAGALPGCDDGSPCTKDSCDAATGTCSNVALTGGCEDGDACTLGDQCAAGACVPGATLNCNDGNPCSDDSCDAKVGCINLASTATCSDGDPCTDGDQCDKGACVAGGPKDCDDATACTLDACKDGICTHLPIDATCTDGNECTEADACKAGTCIGKNKDCADQSPCTNDSCKAGQCVHQQVPEKTACDDGDPCTQGDLCDHDGNCKGVNKDCDDANPCTLDKCQVTNGNCEHEPTQGQPCDDGNPCTLGDACQAGVCLTGAPKTCSDGNVCTKDACDVASGACAFTAADGPCSDNDPCTVGDLCKVGKCQAGATTNCNDQNPCTIDTCSNVDGACAHTNTVANVACDDGKPCTQGDACKNGACQDGKPITCDDGDPCTTDNCDPLTGTCVYPFANGAACDDGNPCTGGDACQSGKCTSGASVCQCVTNSDCAAKEDGDLCNGTMYCELTSHTCQVNLKTVVVCDSSKDTACLTWACNAKNAKCEPTNAPSGKPCDADSSICTVGDSCLAGLCTPGPGVGCDDGNPCTNDLCDAKTGCTYTPNQKPCSDANPCTEIDICSYGKCFGGGQKYCDDGNPCTTDECDASNGLCVGKAVSGPACDDANACTLGDACTQGVCQSTSSVVCNDGKVCTTDSCNPKNGNCGFSAAPDGLQCEDGSKCTVGDACKAGACAAGKATVCVDGSPCTIDGCDLVTGLCAFKPGPNGTPCSDGDACTIGDVCAGGGCTVGAPKVCTDSNPCALPKCDPTSGKCVVKPGNLPCDDGNACSGGDTCTDGVCKPASFQVCNDGQWCTNDSCDTKTGACVFVTVAQPCNDGDACTAGDACKDGACQGKPVACNDGNPCTSDSCDPAKGCQFAPANDGGVCTDGNACTSGDACLKGSCKGTGITCNDGNPCTSDTCDTKTGCKYTPTTGACNDGNPCTVGDSCATGKCVSGTQAACNDSNPCSDDVCDPKTGGCAFTNDNTNPCSDGNACTIGDGCKDGKCAAGATNKDCADNNPCTTEWCDPAAGCKVVANPAVACDDGNACTTKDICVGSTCNSGTIDLCDDNNVCTADTCDKAKGCQHSAADVPCDDGDACVGPDACASGTCKGKGAVVCDDTNVCTNDTCDPKAGCVHAPVAGGGSKTDLYVSNGLTQASGTMVPSGGQFPDFVNFKPAAPAWVAPFWKAQIPGATWIWTTTKVADPANDAHAEFRQPFAVDDPTKVTATLMVAADNAVVCWINNTIVASGMVADNYSAAKVVSVKAALQPGQNLLRCQVISFGVPDSTPESNPAGLSFRLEIVTLVTGAPCNDGNPCTTTDVCFGGACTGVVGQTCDDGNACTVDTCVVGKGCTNAFKDGQACEDGNPCSTGDTCKSGKCMTGQAVSCDDGLACTVDVCDVTLGCKHGSASNGVFTAITVHSDTKTVVAPPSGPSSPAVATWDQHPEWTHAVTGATWLWSEAKVSKPEVATTVTFQRTFDVAPGFETIVGVAVIATDGAFLCKLNGKLVGVEVSEVNYKTPIKISLNGKIASGANVWQCTVTNPGKPGSTWQTNPAGLLYRLDLQWYAKGGAVPCEDGNACTAGDWCKAFVCQPGAVVSCDDDDACTADFCDAKAGCGHAASGAVACDDGNPCTVSDFCLNGKCAAGKSADCNDGNPCTADSCDAKSGCASGPADGAPCDDGNPCTIGDACSSGACAGGGAAKCDDGNVCTNDVCSTQQGCFYTLANGAACTDGNGCTINDACSGGQCVGSSQNACSDNNACTSDLCDPVAGCKNTPLATGACDDGNACTLGDACKSGQCASGSNKPCNDGNPCTTDSCDPKTAACLFVQVADQTPCEDGNPCTVGDVCGKGKCIEGGPRECGDGNPCTDDACDPTTGNCVNTVLVGTYSCDDGDPCSLGDTCKAGACTGAGKNCDDKDKCTIDSCNSGTGQCFYKAVVPCLP